MNLKSIRVRLTFWYTSLLTVTFLILAGATNWLLVYTLSQDVDASLNSVAKALIEQARKSPNPFFPPDIDDVFRRFFRLFASGSLLSDAGPYGPSGPAKVPPPYRETSC